MNYFFSIVIGISLVSIPWMVFADTSSVKNSVKLSSSSGGNSAQGGSTVEGTSQSSISITTIHNGTVVEDIRETTMSGESLVIESVYESVGTTQSISVKTDATDRVTTVKGSQDSSQDTKTGEEGTPRAFEGGPDTETSDNSTAHEDEEDSEVDQMPEETKRFSITLLVARLISYVRILFTI